MLKTIAIVVIALHGIIHLFGYAKAFDLAYPGHLKHPISKVNGVLWLLGAILFIAAAASLALGAEWWWLPSGIAVLISQYLIYLSWQDAKFGTIANAIVIILTIVGITLFQPDRSYGQVKELLVAREYIVPLVISNLVFGLTLLAAVKRPMFARVFLSLGFLGAGVFNIWAATNAPEAYLTYADLTPVWLYEDFIRGYFSSHVPDFVISIAIGQILIGLALIFRNGWTRLACVGGIAFGVSIVPLGVGSGFPSSLVMAMAFYSLLKRKDHDLIWKWNQYSRPQPHTYVKD